MPDVGVLNLTIKDNSEKAGKGLEYLSDALVAVKHAVTGGLGLDGVASEITKLAKTIQEAKGTSTIVKNLGTMFNAINNFSKIKSFTIDTDKIRSMAENMLKLADAKERVDEASKSGAGVSDWRSGMMGISETAQTTKEKMADVADSLEHSSRRIFNLQFFGGKGSSQSPGQIAMDLDGLLQKTESVTETITQEYKDMVGVIEKTPVDFSKFNVSDLPQNVLGMTIEQYRDGAMEAIKFGDAVRDAETTVLGMKAKADVARFDSNETKGVIVYQEKMEDSWENICDRMAVANRELEQYFEGQKQVIFGNESIQHLWEDNRIGPALQGMFGDETQAAMMQKISEATGLSVENITEQLSRLSNSFDYLKQKSSEATNGGIGTANTGIDEISKSSEYAASELDLLRNKLRLLYNDIDRRESSLVKRGVDLWDDKRLNDMLLAAIRLNDQIERMTELNKNATMSSEGTAKISALGEMSNIELMTAKYDAMKESLARAYDQGKLTTEQYYDAGIKLENLRNKIEEVAKTDQYLGLVDEKVKNIGDSAIDGSSKIQLLKNKIEELNMKIADRQAHMEVFGANSADESAINKYKLQIASTNDQIQKLIDKAHEAQEALMFNQMKSASMESIDQQVKWTEQDVSNLVNNYSQIELLEMKMHGMEDALARDINANKLDQSAIADRTMAIQNLKDKIEELKQKQEETTDSAFSLGNAYKSFKKSLEAMFPTLTSLYKSFVRMAKMRAIRYVIRQIAAGFKEGTQNVYEYSKAIGSTFHESMDEAASALAQMKNALGAELAPLLQMLIPILQNVINWFINLLNYANQFFALLNGQKTWTRALSQTTEAFSKQEKAAKKTGAALKDLLADWDELNIIQSQNSGGAGGGSAKSAEDYLKMFEEVSTFDSKIKDTVEWIKDNIDLIKHTAEAIGIAILGWKFSNAFLNNMATFKSLFLGGLSIAVGLQLSWTGAYAAGLNGEFDATTLLSTASGILLSTIGGALIGWQIGGTWGAVIGGAAGLIASVSVAVVGYFDGERTRKEQEKWGKIHLTEEQINEMIDSQVTGKVKADLEIVDASVKTRAQARLKADIEIMKFSSQLTAARFSLKADNAPEAINNALTSAQTAISAIQEELTARQEGLTLSFTKFKYTDKDGNDVTSDLYKKLSTGESAVQTFYSDLGKEIAQYISKGFGEGLSEEEQLMAMQLMETLDKITTQAERNYEVNKTIRENRKQMDQAYDLETANTVFDVQNERLESYKSTRYNQMLGDLEDQYRSLEQYKQIQQYFAENNNDAKVAEYQGYIDAAQTAIDNLEEWTSQIEKGAYDWYGNDEDYRRMWDNMKEMWLEKLSAWYSESVLGSFTEEGVENKLDNNETAQKIMHQFGLSNQLLLSDKIIDEIIRTVLAQNMGNQAVALVQLMDKLPGLTSEAILQKYFPEVYNSGMDYEKFPEAYKQAQETASKWNNTTVIDEFYKLIEPVEKNTVANDELSKEATHIIEMIQNAIDSDLGMEEIEAAARQAKEMFGDQAWLEALPQISQMMDVYRRITERMEEFDKNNSSGLNPARVTGGMGVSDVGWTPKTYGDIENSSDMTGAVASGVRDGNEEQNLKLDEVITWLSRLYAKNISVNFTPTSAAGAWVAGSQAVFNKVTG